MSISYEQSKNWKAPALKWPAGLGECEKDMATTSAADQHPPRKIVLAEEKSTLPGTPPPDIHQQPFDGVTPGKSQVVSQDGYAARAARNI